MELRQIQYFVELYKECNITKASHNLFISQQGLSKSISKLEAELGIVLFERSISGVHPTKDAEKLYFHAEKVLESCHNLSVTAEEICRVRSLKILAPPGFALTVDREEFVAYDKLYPDAKTSYKEVYNQCIPKYLQKHEADIAYMLAPIPDELQSHQIVGNEPLCVVMNMNHSLSQREKICINELENQSFVRLDIFREWENTIFEKMRDLNKIFSIHREITINEFIPLIYANPFLGFSTISMYRYYDISGISFIPITMPDGSFIYLESHIVTLKNITPEGEVKRYIEYLQKKFRDVF